MANIANVRRFNGTSDEIELTATGFVGTGFGPVTFAAIVQRGASAAGNQAIISVEGGTGGEAELMGQAPSNIGAWMEPNTRTSPDNTFLIADAWCLIAFTKPTGTVVGRWHRYRYSDSNWSHVDDDVTCANVAAVAGTPQAWLGTYDGTQEFFNGDMACVGLWQNVELSDASIESLTDHINDWVSLSPTALWLLNQTVVTDPVLDLIGGADEIARNGTTVVTPTGLTFDAGAAARGRNYRRFVGPTALSSAPETLYTVPDNGRSVIRNIYANNPSSVDAAVTLSIGADEDATHIWDEDTVPAGDILFARRDTNYVLEAGEMLQGFASGVGPAFVGAGAGVEQLVAGTVTVSKTGCTAGNFIIAVNFDADDTGGGSWQSGTTTNIADLTGAANAMTSFVNTTNRQIAFGRVMTDGTVSRDVTVVAGDVDNIARIYEFSGVHTGTLIGDVREANGEVGFTTSTTIADSGVTTLGSDRLALQFVFVRSPSALGPFTGETGGDWVEEAEYNGSTLTLQLQMAEMPDVGTIDGGTITIPSAYWGVTGVALIPSAPVLVVDGVEYGL